MILRDVSREGSMDSSEYSCVIGVPKQCQDIRDRIGRHDEINQCADDGRFDVLLRGWISGTIPYGNGVFDEKHLAERPAHFGWHFTVDPRTFLRFIMWVIIGHSNHGA